MKISSIEQDQLDKNTDHFSKLIRINTVIELTGLSRSYIYQLSDKGLFPKSIKLVAGGTSVAWLQDEIFAWIESRIQERDQEVA